MKRLAAVFSVVLASLFLLPSALAQGVIYAATGSNGTAGSLYVIDLNSEVETLIGPITNGPAGGAIGLTGIAFNPATDTLYGVTVNSITFGNTLRQSLVTIDPLTGVATVIGDLGRGISDIAFSADGSTLYGFQTTTPWSLATINLTTAATTTIGNSGLPFVVGGGLEFGLSGTLYLSAKGTEENVGTLDRLNPTNGVLTTGPAFSGAAFAEPTSGINALTLDNQGTMYAANTDRGGPPNSPAAVVHLATLNLTTGAITDLFRLPDNTDAIAWRLTPVPEASTTAMLVLGGAGGIALAAYRRRAKRR